MIQKKATNNCCPWVNLSFIVVFLYLVPPIDGNIGSNLKAGT